MFASFLQINSLITCSHRMSIQQQQEQQQLMEKFRICSAAHLSHCWAETSFGDSSAHIGLGLSQPPRESMVVELWGAEWRWKGRLDFLITFVWCSSCLLVWLLVIGRIWGRFIENETFVVNYWSTFWGGSGGVCTLWSRGLRSRDVNTVGGNRGLFSCDSLLVWFAEFTHPGSMKLIT